MDKTHASSEGTAPRRTGVQTGFVTDPIKRPQELERLSVFIGRPAYGRIGGVGVGGIEIIGYDPATGQYRSHFYDSQGNQTTQALSYRDNAWIWQGKGTRCTGVFGDEGKTLTARHERSDDGVHWVPSMNVVLRKVD